MMQSVLKKGLLLVAGLAAAAGYFAMLERHPPIGKPVAAATNNVAVARVVDEKKPPFPNVEYVVPADTMVCSTLNGLDQAKRSMSKSQLESLGCMIAPYVLPVERSRSNAVLPPSYRDELVGILLPEKVVQVWVRGRDLKENPNYKRPVYR